MGVGASRSVLTVETSFFMSAVNRNLLVQLRIPRMVLVANDSAKVQSRPGQTKADVEVHFLAQKGGDAEL